ncbi:MAG: hypothetical protein AB1918_18765 [Pseudomonadota bacterium]
MLMTQTEYAAHIGKTKQYVNKLVRQGRIALVDGKVDRDAADAALRGSADPARRLNEPAERHEVLDDDDAPMPRGGDGGMTFQKARTAREAYQAQLAKIELDKQRARLVDKAEVERQAFETGRLTRDRILALVPQIAGQLASMTDEREIAALLRERLKDVLLETARDVRLGGEDL